MTEVKDIKIIRASTVRAGFRSSTTTGLKATTSTGLRATRVVGLRTPSAPVGEPYDPEQ